MPILDQLFVGGPCRRPYLRAADPNSQGQHWMCGLVSAEYTCISSDQKNWSRTRVMNASTAHFEMRAWRALVSHIAGGAGGD